MLPLDVDKTANSAAFKTCFYYNTCTGLSLCATSTTTPKKNKQTLKLKLKLIKTKLKTRKYTLEAT